MPTFKEEVKCALKYYKEACTEENRDSLFKFKEAANTEISKLKNIK